ncbi:response regulator transcription factor [Comamonas terrigena]|uniref:response regulator transcription factor n=1 Tax=Comamonas terrigena TaxID=32013 RepID=UPI0024482653|nr:response regulator transcription factor [Comamonas terrigena]MDH0050830.1 response regulator transcription factor [Comamonas terrigena]MDH0513232.1 response regulator transcription factor [Comamonas terrigena]MDH1093235.1 response regulator transcription factor [Comamonas terrigena]MDH1292236.1 response regulator transcription factor [Comamonas terrigena]MDH1500643.1 response regulator transcription factor [Comamonas terrigena]
MIQVVLCDDHAVLRRGIRDTLQEATDIRVTAEAASYTELREALRTASCEVLLLDINMPGRNGLEVLASVRETHPEIKVIMVSMYPEDQYALRSLKAGAQGYANKAGDPVQLIEAVRMVMQGRKYLTAEVAQMLAESVAQPQAEVLHETLSEREMQTLQKIATGRRLTDIAEELMLSPKTVSVYRARVLEKLQLANNAELTVYAIRNNLV